MCVFQKCDDTGSQSWGTCPHGSPTLRHSNVYGSCTYAKLFSKIKSQSTSRRIRLKVKFMLKSAVIQQLFTTNLSELCHWKRIDICRQSSYHLLYIGDRFLRFSLLLWAYTCRSRNQCHVINLTVSQIVCVRNQLLPSNSMQCCHLQVVSVTLVTRTKTKNKKTDSHFQLAFRCSRRFRRKSSKEFKRNLLFVAKTTRT